MIIPLYRILQCMSERARLASACPSTAVRMADVTEHWLTVAGIPTHVLKCGSLLPGRPLALMLPGNPGLADYYEEFMATLYECSGHQLAVWTVSHAGHVPTPKHVTPQYPKDDIYSISGQIRHKLAFVRDCVPPDTPLILMGHSIGAYILLHLVSAFSGQVLQGALLFPTIERMASTPKGSVMTPLLRYLRWIVPLATIPVHYLLPLRLKAALTQLAFRGREVPDCAMRATLRLVSPMAAANACYMGHTEMQGVREADHQLIDAHKHKLMFYYGRDDHWCPKDFCEDMKKRHPDVDIRLCKKGYDHAFVLEHSAPVAQVVYDWLKEKEPALFVD